MSYAIVPFMDSQKFDYIIIGAGIAGLTSAQYGARAGLKTLVIDFSASGGQALQIAEVENYPGVYPSVPGSGFIVNMIEQTTSFGAKIIQTQVFSIDKSGTQFLIKTAQGTFSSISLLIATGAKHNTLGIPGELELIGQGVSYCATCDGPFFADKKIIVVGGGDAACDESVYLSTISKDVTLIHRGAELRAQKAVSDKVVKAGVQILFNTKVTEVCGKNFVQSVRLENVKTGETSEMQADAIFIFIGVTPRTDLVSTLPTDESGYILSNENMETIIPGLYVAGDVRAKSFRQLVTAAADGAIAAHQAAKYIYQIKSSSN